MNLSHESMLEIGACAKLLARVYHEGDRALTTRAMEKGLQTDIDGAGVEDGKVHIGAQ